VLAAPALGQEHPKETPPPDAQSTEITQVQALLDKSFKAMAQVQDYSGVMIKRERFGDEVKTETMKFKFARPFKVYAKVIAPKEGEEAMYIKGSNHDKVRAHLGRFPDITVSLDPRGRRAMKDNRHPITSFGIEHMLEVTANNIRKAIRRHEGTFKVSDDTVLGQAAWRIDVTYPKGGRWVVAQKGENLWDFAERVGQDMFVIMENNKDIDSPTDIDAGQRIFVPCHYAGLGEYFITKKTGILIKASSWGQSGQLMESYEYPELHLNPGLTAKDFDYHNKEYDF